MLPYLFILLAVAARFLIVAMHSHPWDFTPLSASLLFFGAYGSRRQLWFPVAALAATDVILSKYVYGYPISWDMYVTWAWYAAIVVLGTRLGKNSKPLWVICSALASSVSFFLISNFAAWASYDMYPKTFSGLVSAYIAGLPFFKYRPVGDVLFTAVFFSIPVLLAQSKKRISGPASV